jgi:hypothetical protein
MSVAGYIGRPPAKLVTGNVVLLKEQSVYELLFTSGGAGVTTTNLDIPADPTGITVLVDWVPANVVGGQVLFDLYNGTTDASRINLYQSDADLNVEVHDIADLGWASGGQGTVVAGAVNRAVVAAAAGDRAVAFGGVLKGTDAGLNMPTGLNKLHVGFSRTNGAFLSGVVRRLAIWNTRLPNATLLALTS